MFRDEHDFVSGNRRLLKRNQFGPEDDYSIRNRRRPGTTTGNR